MTHERQNCVTDNDLAFLKRWFTRYVQSFYSIDPVVHQAVLLKENHSLRVCAEILAIGRRLGLRPHELRIAEVMALFHDIGRFEQVTRHQTFVDMKSENHASFGRNRPDMRAPAD